MRTVESSRILATSADATFIGALATDPVSGIVVPFVALVGDGTERGLDVVPPTLVIEPATNQLRDERAASPTPGTLIELGNELVIDRNVQSHVLTIAHCPVNRRQPRRVRAALTRLKTTMHCGPKSRIATGAKSVILPQIGC